MADFDYSQIPTGFYDEVIRTGNPIRRSWHLQKFERVLDCLPIYDRGSILDVGCFAGTLLSLVSEERFARQVGVDILPEQIAYANRVHGTRFRKFRTVASPAEIMRMPERFDCITLVEVIEHLSEAQIREMLHALFTVLRPGGKLVISTPNYASAWPAIELLLNRVSDISYAEQHVTKLNYFTVEERLRQIVPDIDEYVSLDFKTSTHFLTPFLAWAGSEMAHRVSRLVPHDRWHLPFGNLLMLVFRRRGVAAIEETYYEDHPMVA